MADLRFWPQMQVGQHALVINAEFVLRAQEDVLRVNMILHWLQELLDAT